MDTEHCGSKGWTRVAHVDMSNKLQQLCPGDLNLITSPIHSCGGLTTPGCASTKFSTHGISYSKVCGRVRGYQVGRPNGFSPYVNYQDNLDLVLDGVLISHGITQKHIWAYATGFERKPLEAFNIGSYNIFCPCADYRYNGTVPPFIGNDYYCVIVELIVTHREVSSTLHHYGLVKDALHPTSVAHTVGCHGSVRHYLFQLLTTLRYVTVIMVTQPVKILLWS